jgi:hypothetical protein
MQQAAFTGGNAELVLGTLASELVFAVRDASLSSGIDGLAGGVESRPAMIHSLGQDPATPAKTNEVILPAI